MVDGRIDIRIKPVLPGRGAAPGRGRLLLREAEPGHDHRPRLDASHAIDPLLQRGPLDELVDIDHLRPVHLTLDSYRPRPRPERARVRGRVALVRAELVEVVVGGDVPKRSHRLGGTVGAPLDDLVRVYLPTRAAGTIGSIRLE